MADPVPISKTDAIEIVKSDGRDTFHSMSTGQIVIGCDISREVLLEHIESVDDDPDDPPIGWVRDPNGTGHEFVVVDANNRAYRYDLVAPPGTFEPPSPPSPPNIFAVRRPVVGDTRDPGSISDPGPSVLILRAVVELRIPGSVGDDHFRSLLRQNVEGLLEAHLGVVNDQVAGWPMPITEVRPVLVSTFEGV